MITVRITGLRGKFWQNNGIENLIGDCYTYCNFSCNVKPYEKNNVMIVALICNLTILY